MRVLFFLFCFFSMSRDDVNKLSASQHHLNNRLYYDSGQSSMEYWDYSVEIECLKGPQGFFVNYLKLTNCLKSF